MLLHKIDDIIRNDIHDQILTMVSCDGEIDSVGLRRISSQIDDVCCKLKGVSKMIKNLIAEDNNRSKSVKLLNFHVGFLGLLGVIKVPPYTKLSSTEKGQE